MTEGQKNIIPPPYLTEGQKNIIPPPFGRAGVGFTPSLREGWGGLPIIPQPLPKGGEIEPIEVNPESKAKKLSGARQVREM